MGEEEPRPDAKRRRKKEEGLSGQGLQGRKGTGKEGLRANDQLGKSNWELLKARGGLSKPKGGREKKVGKEKGTSSSGSGKDNGKKKREVQRGQPDIARGNLTRLLAIDCEMVGAGVGGSVSLLARVSIVNANGQVVYDSYVSPDKCVTDYRTRFSGIRPHHIKNAPKKRDVVAKVRSMVAGRVLCGHAIHNDLDVLEIDHPETHIRDSSKYPRLMRHLPNGKLKPKKLSVLAAEELNLRIQADDCGHCSVQDARATMALYKKHEHDWEKWHRKTSAER